MDQFVAESSQGHFMIQIFLSNYILEVSSVLLQFYGRGVCCIDLEISTERALFGFHLLINL